LTQRLRLISQKAVASLGTADANITYDNDSKTALVAAKGTNIAAWVIRPTVTGTNAVITAQAQPRQVVSFPNNSPYQIQFYPIYDTALSTAKLDKIKDAFCVVVIVQK
jgi:hypothetical protein